MKYRWDKKYLYWGVTIFLVIVASLLCFAILFNPQILTGILGFILKILTPVLYGLIFAFLLNLGVRALEKLFARVFRKKIAASARPLRWQKASRATCITAACLLFLAILAGLLWMVIPQLISSISGIVTNFNDYYHGLQSWLDGLLKNHPETAETIGDMIYKAFDFIKTWFQEQSGQIITGVTNGVISGVGIAANLLIGFIIAIYLLFNKEKFLGQAKKMLYSMVKKNWSNGIIRTCQQTNRLFSGFIGGQLLDSFIVGVLCFIIMSIFQMPFSLLISVIVACTNVIPFFGPFIGGIPSAILILMVNPLQCLYFIIMILVLQQIDGNIISPRIQGDITGLSGFWVIFSITIFGGLFGILGIVMAVPAFAVLYSLLKRWTERSLKRRKMSTQTETYMEIGCIYQSDPTEEIDDPHYPLPQKVTPEQRAASEAAARDSKNRRKVSGWINRIRKNKTDSNSKKK